LPCTCDIYLSQIKICPPSLALFHSLSRSLSLFFYSPLNFRTYYILALSIAAPNGLVCVCARVCIDVWVCASVNVSICHFCSQLFSSSAICGSKSPSSTRNAFVPCARFIVTDRPRPLLYIPFNPTYGTSIYVPYTRVYIYKVGGRMIE